MSPKKAWEGRVAPLRPASATARIECGLASAFDGTRRVASRAVKAIAVWFGVLLWCGVARAEDDLQPAPPPADPPATVEPTPATDTSQSVRGAPRPGQESGRLDPVDTGDGTGRIILRGLLWIPRLPFEIVMAPVRGTIYLGERYDAVRTLTEVFTTDDHHVAIYPTALIETGFGLNVGVRGSVKNVFGADERLRMRAGFGGEYLWTAAAGVDSGTLIPGPVHLAVDGVYARRDRDQFFGYGNDDEHDVMPTPIDPLGDTGIASRYRLHVSRVSARVRVQLPASIAVTLASAYAKKTYRDDSPDTTDPDLGDVYVTDQLPGFADGTRFLYNEVELAWDTRRQADAWDAPGMRSTGNLVTIYGGRQHALDDGPDFNRIGVDLQRFVRIAGGPRVLQLRLWGEGVTGDRDKVPFTELPRLGGEYVLRGYDLDRFRDRLAVVAQAAYTWAAASWLAPMLFVDAGRVFASFDDLSGQDLRVGFGGAIELYNRRGLLLRAQLGTSIDGGVFGFVSLNPAYDALARVERY